MTCCQFQKPFPSQLLLVRPSRVDPIPSQRVDLSCWRGLVGVLLFAVQAPAGESPLELVQGRQYLRSFSANRVFHHVSNVARSNDVLQAP